MSIPKRLVPILCLWPIAVLLPGCYFLDSEPVPEVSSYDLDLPQLRALSLSGSGELPVEVRLEEIATATLPGKLMMAGKSWDGVEMAHVVFQLLWADGRYLLIDSAQDRGMHEATPGGDPFQDAAWEQIVTAMEGATQVVITHEHPDHLGGVARHPRPEAIAPIVRLTSEQLANDKELAAIDFPESLRDQLEPLDYDDVVVIAPGVVLKKAPGHTPGSQMVFVTFADGRERLFVGDVVWNLDAILELRYRTRLITDWVIGEDREAAINQLRALRDLYDQGGVDIVVSHDRRTHESAGIGRGFVLPANPSASNAPKRVDPAARSHAGDADSARDTQSSGVSLRSLTLGSPTRDSLEKS